MYPALSSLLRLPFINSFSKDSLSFFFRFNWQLCLTSLIHNHLHVTNMNLLCNSLMNNFFFSPGFGWRSRSICCQDVAPFNIRNWIQEAWISHETITLRVIETVALLGSSNRTLVLIFASFEWHLLEVNIFILGNLHYPICSSISWPLIYSKSKIVFQEVQTRMSIFSL